MPYRDPEQKREYNRKYHEEHRDELREYQRKWEAKRFGRDVNPPRPCEMCGQPIYMNNTVGVCQRTPDCKVEARNRWRAANPDKVRANKRRYQIKNGRRVDLMKKFGMTIEQYDALLMAQGGACAICRNPETARDSRDPHRIRNMAVDHDHTTGRVRGLLCTRCNTSISSHLTAAHYRAIADYLDDVQETRMAG